MLCRCIFLLLFLVNLHCAGGLHWFATNASSDSFEGCGSPNKVLGEVGTSQQHCDNGFSKGKIRIVFIFQIAECSGWQPRGLGESVLTVSFSDSAMIGPNSKLRIYGSWPTSASLVVTMGNFTASPFSVCDCGFTDIALPDFLVGSVVGPVFIRARSSTSASMTPNVRYCAGFSNLFLVQAVVLEYGCGTDCQQGFCADDSNKTSNQMCSCFEGWRGANCTIPTNPNTPFIATLPQNTMMNIKSLCYGSRKIQLQLDSPVARPNVDFLLFMNTAVEMDICVENRPCRKLGPYGNMRSTTVISIDPTFKKTKYFLPFPTKNSFKCAENGVLTKNIRG